MGTIRAVHTPSAPIGMQASAARPSPALPPFTHHEILAVSEPFVRAGLAPDLAATDREARRLAFRGCEHAAGAIGPGLPALRETLVLEHPERDAFALERAFELPDGLRATLRVEGTEPAALLAAVLAVPPQRQFLVAAGVPVALGLRLSVAGSAQAAVTDPQAAEPVLRGASAQVGGMLLQWRMSGVPGYPGELELLRTPAAPARLPDDLLAVLGPAWGRLSALSRGWQAPVRLRGADPQRSRDARARLQTTVAHLAATLAAPPSRFHQRFRGARWRVSLRRSLPLGIGLALTALALWMRAQGPETMPVLGMLANIAPPILLGLIFLRPEMISIELPRIPRRPRDDAWSPAGPATTGEPR